MSLYTLCCNIYHVDYTVATKSKFIIFFSERADPNSHYNKGRLKEGANINKSLVTLGNVIQSLGE